MKALSGSVTFSGSTPSGDYDGSDGFVVVGAGETCALSAPSVSVASAGSSTIAVVAIDGQGGCSAAGSVSSAASVTWDAVTDASNYAVWVDGALTMVLGTLDLQYPPTDPDAADRSEACLKHADTSNGGILPVSHPGAATRQLWRFDGGAPPAGDGTYTAFRDDRAVLETGGDLEWAETYRFWILPGDDPLDLSLVRDWRRATVIGAWTDCRTRPDPPLDNAWRQWAISFAGDQIVERATFRAEFWACMWTIGDGHTSNFAFSVTDTDGFVMRDVEVRDWNVWGSWTTAIDTASKYSDQPTKLLLDNVGILNFGGVGHNSCTFVKGYARLTNCIFRCERAWSSHGNYFQPNDWGVSVTNCIYDGVRGLGSQIYASSNPVSGRADYVFTGNHYRKVRGAVLYATSTKGLVFQGNTIRNCDEGLRIHKSRSVVVANNTFEDSIYAVNLSSIDGFVLRGNVCTNIVNDGASEEVLNVSECTAGVISDNVIHWDNPTDLDGNALDESQMIALSVYDCDNVRIAGNVVDEYARSYPVQITKCRNCDVDNNHIATTQAKLGYLFGSSGSSGNTGGRFTNNFETNGGSAAWAQINTDGTTIGANTYKVPAAIDTSTNTKELVDSGYGLLRTDPEVTALATAAYASFVVPANSGMASPGATMGPTNDSISCAIDAQEYSDFSEAIPLGLLVNDRTQYPRAIKALDVTSGTTLQVTTITGTVRNLTVSAGELVELQFVSIGPGTDCDLVRVYW